MWNVEIEKERTKEPYFPYPPSPKPRPPLKYRARNPPFSSPLKRLHSMARKKKQRNHPPPPPPVPLHPILNLLPPAIQSSVSVLSRQDREVLAYMITIFMVMESSDLNPSSKKAKETQEPFSCNGAAHKSPVFGCQCFPCYGTYWERWTSTSSSNRRRIDQAIEAFENSLAIWENDNANSTKNTANSRRKDKSCSHVSLPAIEEEVEEGIDKEEKEEPVEKTTPEPEKQDFVIDLSAVRETNQSFAGNVIPNLLGFFNSRIWSLWNPKV